MTSLASFKDFRSLALGGPGGPSVAVPHKILPDTNSPGVALSAIFRYQSYYDSTLQEKALLIQSTNQPIIDSTRKQEGLGGYCVGLHPSSQTPIAIQFDVGGSSASNNAVILRPGQIYRPHGKPKAGEAGNFSSFSWGLPFGWLGGGMATLYVFASADADVAWPGNAEVLFHRQRMQIYAPGSAPADALKNWPLRFPWSQAVRGASSIPQKGVAQVAISDPTRILMSLRLGALAAANDVRLLLQSSNDFDVDSLGATVATGPRFQDMTWGTYAASGAGGNLAVNYPVQEVTGPIARLAADDGGLCMVDITGGLSGGAEPIYVDIARYGRI